MGDICMMMSSRIPSSKSNNPKELIFGSCIDGNFDISTYNLFPFLKFNREFGIVSEELFPGSNLQKIVMRTNPKFFLSQWKRPSSPLSSLTIRPGFLRSPPAFGKQPVLYSATLSHAVAEHEVTWADQLLTQDDWFSPDLAERTRHCVRSLIADRLGGTWWGAPARPLPGGQKVVFAGRNDAVTRDILGIALSEFNASDIVLVLRKTGKQSDWSRVAGITVISGIIDPWTLIETASDVYVGEDADEALIAHLLDIPVHCLTPATFRSRPDIFRLVAATLLLGTRYVSPFTGRALSCEAFIELAREWRGRMRTHTSVSCCVGVSFWKRLRMSEILGGRGAPVFKRSAQSAVAVARRRGGAIAVWASRVPDRLDSLAQEAGVPVMRIEDGFIRSAGLGADFLPPLSIVLDDIGLYYDSTQPSRLETILSTTDFSPDLLARSKRLRLRVVSDKVTKYNLSDGMIPVRPDVGNTRIVLVPGQVANDRSVLLGGGGAEAGLALLRRVRKRMPDAHILYKPHPDVEAGHRPGIVADRDALAYADQIIRGGDMDALLSIVDEVHTLTSLTGFEALLRGKPVTTYGQPFYAGWGLTTDTNPPSRRARKLTLDELVASTLILYPTYIDPISLLLCGPEVVLDRLSDPALRTVSALVRARRFQGLAWNWLRQGRALLQSPTAWISAP